MTSTRMPPVVALSFLLATSALAPVSLSGYREGEIYEITKSYKTSEKSSDGSSASSSGHDSITERVVTVRDRGVELEYDLGSETKPDERARNWQFPARVLAPANGPMRLVNVRELEARLGAWLKAAGSNRTICGQWIFTWNAFRIDCDPQSVIEKVKRFDIVLSDVREGANFTDAEALAPGALVKSAIGREGTTFTVALKADPMVVRRVQAEADVAAGAIMREPVTFESALIERSKEQVSGSISVVLEAGQRGEIRKRIKVTKLEIKRPDGVSQRRTITETIERRLVTARPVG